MASSFGKFWSDPVSQPLRRPSVTRASSLDKAPPTSYAASAASSQENSFQRFALPDILNGRHHHSVSFLAPAPRRRDSTTSVGSSGDNASGTAGGDGVGGRRERTRPGLQQAKTLPIATAYEGVVVASPRSDGRERTPLPAGLPTLQQSSSSDAKGNGVPPPRSPITTGIASRDRTKARTLVQSSSSLSVASPRDPKPQFSFHKQIPRAMPVGAVSPRASTVSAVNASSAVKASTAPPPLPVHRRATIATAVLSPSRTEARPQSLPVSVRARARELEKRCGGEVEQRSFFHDPRLEATLSLIRSGQIFCEEEHILVDFVRRAKPTIDGRAGTQLAEDVFRHALLLTNAALYLLEVEMLSNVPPAHRPNGTGGLGESRAGEQRGSGGRPAVPPSSPSMTTPSPTKPASVVLAATAGESRLLKDGGGGGGASGPGKASRVVASTAVIEKAKVKSIKMMDRLKPSELVRVSLPFKEVTLRNGDIVARRGCGLVLHTRVEGRRGYVWLKCRSNQDRGALVDALVPWYESNSPDQAELFVQQVPESPLAMQLARLEAPARGGAAPTRPKDTDCILS